MEYTGCEDIYQKADDMSVGIITVSFEGIIQYINPAAEKIFGLGAKETEGRRFASVFLRDEKKHKEQGTY